MRDKLRATSPVANCIVVGVSDPITGQTPWAFITLMTGLELLEKDQEWLTANCVADVGEHAAPSQFVVIEEIPETMTGKYMRRIV